MTPASKACMDRMLSHIATCPGDFWSRWDDARSSGASQDECKRLERAAYQAETFAREEAKRIRASFEAGESWAEEG